MEFGSEYVYEYEQPDYEYISDEELDVGMDVSESSSSDDDDDETAECSTTADAEIKSTATTAGPSALTDSLESKSSDVTVVGPPKAPPLPPPRAHKKKGFFNMRKKHKPVSHWKQADMDGMYADKVDSMLEEIGQRAAAQSKGKKVRRADTNIVSIKFNKLTAPSDMHTGDSVYCKACQAILSHISKLTTTSEGKMWQCEFCGENNTIDLEEEEIPKADDVTFMLEPALATKASGPSGTDESLVIFCIDISGSMCVTTQVPGRINFRGANRLQQLQTFNDDRSDQYLPGQRRDVTFVSRLQAAQAAVDHQLEEMLKNHPNRRVALITFNNEVALIGDGTTTPVTVAGDKLTNKEELSKVGVELGMPNSLQHSRKVLGNKIFELEEGGGTALGPALLIATAMAGQHPGSKVIICTDGLANVGLGRLDNLVSEESFTETEGFYESVGITAVEKGVSISVISIQGTDCKLVQLGKVADATGGQVNIVDPLKLTQEFSTILADRIIATNVVATFILHKGLFIHYEEKEESRVVRNIGNVTEDSEITFEYGVRARQKESKPQTEAARPETIVELPEPTTEEPMEDVASGSTASGGHMLEAPKEELKDLPFQLQIQYTDTEGAKALRVITQVKPVTRDRKLAEKKMNIDVVGAHTAALSGQLALEGQYTISRTRAMMNQRLAWRYANTTPEGQHHQKQYRNMFGKIRSVESYCNEQQKNERSARGTTYSDEEDEDEEYEGGATGTTAADAAEGGNRKSLLGIFGKKKKKMASRSRETSDEGANIIYKSKGGGKFFK